MVRPTSPIAFRRGNPPSDFFDRLHDRAGEACDYLAMKKDMLASVAGADGGGWFDFDFDLSWIEFPDIDWSIFDFFD